ncbi:FecR family protein [Mucilaginibacter sp. FT3.2]|uniref:FecR family protein n=1 Tax=Mucilaginibacter sp. FT3.2 TaxID=2723090 RepID=UPI00161D4D3B|nr:FecR domain-containing protein [Mucilaginibacter sp. FT3.2]MBB6234912.1 ferric-dicitrate binding protein FerR (iron transport regulator) [Mucilaginibacter sp. FT3.2]
MDQEIIRLLKKYISNNSSPQELEEVRQIIESGNFEQEWELVLKEEAVLDMADDSVIEEPAFDSEKVLDKIRSTTMPVRKLAIQPWLIGIAAILLLTLSIGFLFFKNRAIPATNVAVLKLVSPAGQQKKITLADGTQIILNCGSTLTYAAKFNNTKREVYLDGEAFFNVKHDASRPFLVHTGRLNVQVLGTSFNVRAYRADAKALVSVASGKVGVNGSKPSGTYMLLPGDRLSYNRDNEFKQDKIKLEDILAWQKGILVFHLETIQEIAPVLARYYGIAITLNPHLYANKEVTASFTQKTLPQVLEILSQTAGFKYVINKNEVYIN